jgi:DNA-binding NarL/FixJ family response regulator
MQKIKIGLFDDHTFIVKGLANFLIANQMEVVFCSSTKIDLLAELNKSEIDILILDIVAPDILGIELFEEIALNYPHINVIAHTTLSSAMLVENLLSIGVRGFINKKQAEADMIVCIENVHANEVSIPEEYHFLTSKYRTLNSNVLSPREIEILQLIAKELTSPEIAEKLALSLFTVENHRKNIFRKLEVKNLAGMIMTASRMGYIS